MSRTVSGFQRLRPWYAGLKQQGGSSFPWANLPAAFDWSPSGERVDVAFYGDSISLGAYAGGTTEPDWVANGFVAQLRATLQASHGDGGIGFINLGRNEWVKTGVWTQITDFGPFAQCWYAENDATKLWTLTVPEGDNIDIFYLNGSGYGAFDVVVDGGAPTTITPSGAADNSTQKANVSLGTEGSHTVVVKAPASGGLYFLGAAVYKGTTGLVLHNISRSGSAVNDLAFQVDRRLGVMTVINPRLNIVGYVANDFSVQTSLSNYETRINTLVAKLKTYGDVGCWIPPDNNLSRAIQVEDYEAIAKSVAIANGGFWLDVHKAWGDYTDNVSRMYDTVHPNTVGHTDMHDLFMIILEKLGA